MTRSMKADVAVRLLCIVGAGVCGALVVGYFWPRLGSLLLLCCLSALWYVGRSLRGRAGQ